MVELGWSSNTDWENAQSSEDININSGTFELADAIPDSEADQKLAHRWYLGETNPFVDQIGNADATNNGTAEVTGDWVDGSARDGDGTDDHIDLTSLGSFGGSDISGGFAIAFSYRGTEGLSAGSNQILGIFNDGDNTALQIPDTVDGAEIYLRDELDQDGKLSWDNVGDFEDNNQHRIVYNIPDPGDVATWEIYADQALENVSIADNSVDPTGSFADFEYGLSALARNVRGTVDNHTDAILDDICVFADSLTDTEAQSYNNPWE